MTAQAHKEQAMPPAIRFLLSTILLNAIGFGIIIPVMPELVMDLGALPNAAAKPAPKPRRPSATPKKDF